MDIKKMTLVELRQALNDSENLRAELRAEIERRLASPAFAELRKHLVDNPMLRPGPGSLMRSGIVRDVTDESED